MTLRSFRRASGDPALEALAESTHQWIHEVRRIAEHEGFPFATGTGAGVLLAMDVLIELHGREASWDLLDVAALERWLGEHGLGEAVPLIIGDVAVFTHFSALLGRVPDAVADAAHDRLEELVYETLARSRDPRDAS